MDWTKLPRKFKKKIKKIPVGDYCYGTAIGDKGMIKDKKRVYKTILCPFSKHQYCSLLNVHEDFLLSDNVKICSINKLTDTVNLGRIKEIKTTT